MSPTSLASPNIPLFPPNPHTASRRHNHVPALLQPPPFSRISPRQTPVPFSAKPQHAHHPTTTQEDGIPADDVKFLVKFKSRHNYIRVLEVSRRADHPFAGSRLLLLDNPGNIHSISFLLKSFTGTYFDVFATLPPILPPGPIGILGFGAGSAAKLILELYPNVVVHGWELDPFVIDVAREYFDLSKVENQFKDRLFVYVGDALRATVRDGFAGIVVDLFNGGVVIPELQDQYTWQKLRRWLREGGRVMVNVGGSCVEAEDKSKDGRLIMEETLKAMREVFGEKLFVLTLGNRKEDSSLAFTGDMPDVVEWKKNLPRTLKGYVNMLFDRAPLRSVFLWNSLIRAYAQANNFEESIVLFNDMLKSDVLPDRFTYACVIRACSDSFTVDGLELAHAKAVASGFSGDAVCSSALVSAYSRLGLVAAAERVFQGMYDYDLVMCNSMINGYGFCGLGEEALTLFNRMRSLGISPDAYSFVGLICGFADSRYILAGQGIHALCLRSGYISHDHVGSAFVSMYARFKTINLAHEVFKELFEPDLVAWSALLTGYCQCGDNEKVLSIFRKMNAKSWKEDRVLITSVVVAVAQLANARPGKEIHGSVIRHNLNSNVIISSALVDMYMKCGKWDMGLHVFENMVKKNTVAYNSVILGLGLHGQASRAFLIFEDMLDVRVKPDAGTFAALLSTCYHSGLGKDGKQIFRRMVDEFCIPLMTEHYVYMVKILGMGGELEEACNFIKALPGPVDSGIWGALLSCCEMHGDTKLADFVARQLYKIEPEKSAYQVMLSNIYAGNERWSDVKNLRDRIGERCAKIPGLSMVS